MSAYYNEFDPFAAKWLRSLIHAGLILDGEVDERSIEDVHPNDLRPFRQCHFFAGIGGWPHALDLAGFPRDREVWTGSCPCQPLSSAGRQKGHADERHIWPAFHRLIAERRPATVFGEQVASKLGREWLAGVRRDLEDAGYACGAANLPAGGFGAPHRRERLFWCGVADASGGRREQGSHAAPALGYRQESAASDRRDQRMADPEGQRPGWRPDDEDGRRGQLASADRSPRGVALGDAYMQRLERCAGQSVDAKGRQEAGRPTGFSSDIGFWRGAEWRVGADGKARRVGPGIRLLAHGVSGRVAVRLPAVEAESEVSQEEHWLSRIGALRGFGNAIVPQAAAAFVGAVLDTRANKPCP